MTQRKSEQPIESDRLLTARQVGELLGVSETSVIRSDGREGFPQSVQVLPLRARRWKLSDVLAYIESLPS
jgi:predicted DNA-binding transcriptional regulator AlpA